MNFLLMLFAVCAGLHAWSYGRVIDKRGNRAGAIGIYILVTATISLSLVVTMK